jgi:hypothetical protein
MHEISSKKSGGERGAAKAAAAVEPAPKATAAKVGPLVSLKGESQDFDARALLRSQIRSLALPSSSEHRISVVDRSLDGEQWPRCHSVLLLMRDRWHTARDSPRMFFLQRLLIVHQKI